MTILSNRLVAAAALYGSAWITNRISDYWLKERGVARHKWDLNICCGITDCGTVNAGIVAHAELSNLRLVDVYRLPFADKRFKRMLFAHNLEPWMTSRLSTASLKKWVRT